MIKFALGKIKFGVGTAAVAPSDGASVDTGTLTPEERSVTLTAQIDGSMTVLRIADIHPYEKNPRQAANPLFDTIKASIRQRGMDAPLKVTRRPGATHYVVAAGGNTRLLAQMQLWQETADPKFETVPVVIKAWRSESDVLAGHLIENEQRADMTFWDKARGVVALKVELEQECAAALSLRQLESALSDIGLPIGKDVLSSYLFAVERLTPLGLVVPTLSRNDVRDHLQPRFRRLGRLAQKFGLGEAALYAHTLDPVMHGIAELFEATQTFSAAELVLASDSALAQTLQITLPMLQAMLAVLDQSPELALTELRSRTGAATVAVPIRTVPVAQLSRRRDASDPDPGTVSPGDGPSVPARIDHGSSEVVSRGDSRSTQDDAARIAASSTQPIEAFKLVLLGFAEMTHCADCLCWHDELPLGFYVEVPGAALDLEPASPRRHASWWLMAFLSGQFDPDLAGVLPEDSQWRRALGIDGDRADERLSLLIHTELGGPLSPEALVAWLTRAPDIPGECALQCLQLARSAWRAQLPSTPSDSRCAAGTA